MLVSSYLVIFLQERIKIFKALKRIESIDEVSKWILKLTLQNKLIF